jgi:hypothetical protein
VLLVVQGLSEKFKEKDINLQGSATLDYETFMLMVLPFIVAWEQPMELAAADNQDGKFFQVGTAIFLSCNSTTHNIGRLQ